MRTITTSTGFTSRISTAVATAVVVATAVITAATASPAGTMSPAAPERPCFIVQPRPNAAVDGPVPSCTTPVEDDVVTLEDCLDTRLRPVPTTCPYPIKSGDEIAETLRRMTYDDEYDRPGR